MANSKTQNQSIFLTIIFGVFLLVQAEGQKSVAAAASSCGGVLDLDFSPGDQNVEIKPRDFCLWAFKLPASTAVQNFQFQRDTSQLTLSLKEKEEDKKTTTITETPKTCRSGYPKSCSEIQSESTGSFENSTERQLENCVIYPTGFCGAAVEVLCDFQSDGGGWTLIQKRSSGPREEFDRTWSEYGKGFGALSGNFWMGLDHIHTLTRDGDQELRIELEDFEGEKRWAKYSNFSVTDVFDFYRLSIDGFSQDSSAGDSMVNVDNSFAIPNGQRFTTKDKDDDGWLSGNCGVGRGGWWFNSCSYSYLNGPHRQTPDGTGYAIRRGSWKEFLAKTEMKIRNRKPINKPIFQ